MDRCAGAAARLPGNDRKDLAVQVLAGSETVSDLAARHGVSRKFVYQQTHKARTVLDDAFSSAVPDGEVLFELTVTKAWLRQVIAALTLICRSSYRGVVEFLRDLLGVPVSLDCVHDVLQAATRQASAINQGQDLSGIRVGLHDEIFQGATPVLAGVDAASTYCYLLATEHRRDADTWGVHLLDAAAQGLDPNYTIADAGQGLRAGQRAAWGDTPCHGDVFHIQRQCEGLATTLARLAKGATSRRMALQTKTGRVGQRDPDSELVVQLELARHTEARASCLARDVRTLTQWLRHDVLALAGPVLATRQLLFDFIVEELAAREPEDPRRIRPVRVAFAEPTRPPARLRRRARCQAGRDRARPRRPRTPGAGSLRAAPLAQHLARILAGMEPASSDNGRQVPHALRRREPGHGAHPAQQLAGGEPQLAAAQLLHPAPAPGRLVSRLAAVLPQPPALPAQPACRAPGQEPTETDDRPKPSALAHPAKPGTASAPASLTRGGSPPAAQDTLPTKLRPPQTGGFRAPCVTQKGRILNHALLCYLLT
jgi:hypothetical protein